MRVASTNPITAMLLDYVKNGALADLTPEKVVPFLRANLHWRVVGVSLAFFYAVSEVGFGVGGKGNEDVGVSANSDLA